MKTISLLFLQLLFLPHLATVLFSQNNCSNDWFIETVTSESVINPIYKPGWTLVFNDEFSGSPLDPDKWAIKYGIIGTEKKFFVEPPNVEVSNGYCNLKAIRVDDVRVDPNTGNTLYCMHTGSWIHTLEKFGPNTFWEIRAKRNKVGFKSSFWSHEFPGAGIPADQLSVFDNDFKFENQLRDIWFESFVKDVPKHTILHISNILPTQDIEYYTYAYDYRVGSHKIFINNQHSLNNISHVPTEPMHICLWTTSIYWESEEYMNQFDYDGEFLIDYIRVYELNSDIKYPLSEFGPSNGWNNQVIRPRFIGDFNGDGKSDLIGFGYQFTKVSLSKSDISTTYFKPISYVLPAFTVEQGWNTQNVRPRLIGDVNADGNDDIIGFGFGGVQVSISKSDSINAIFTDLQWVTSFFTAEQGFTNMRVHPRMIGDVNGDGKADLVGFADDGVYVALSKSEPSIASYYSPVKISSYFGCFTGWLNQDFYPRFLADVNDDGKDDIIGFFSDGVYVSISTSSPSRPSFLPPQKVLSFFGTDNGFYNNFEYPRFLADVNGDGKADIVGFSNEGVYVSISLCTNNFASFGKESFTINYFNISNGFDNINEHPRFLVDINNDNKADIVGFGKSGVEVAISSFGIDGLFFNQNLLFDDFTQCKGWIDNNTYPRHFGDIDGDGFNDIIGFGFSQVHSFNGFNPATYNSPYKANSINPINEDIANQSYQSSENVQFTIYKDKSTGLLEFKSIDNLYVIEIFNSSGQMVYNEKLDNNHGSINIDRFLPGIYFVKAIGKHGSVTRKIWK